MRKLFVATICFIIITLFCSFTIDEKIIREHNKPFSINSLATNEKKFNTEEIKTCGLGYVKSYMDYRAITSPSSKQYKYIEKNMTVDEETGFLYDDDGFIGVALGLYYGEIGTRYYFTLENNVVIPIVKIESKASVDTDELNCYNPNDNSVIEFVVDRDIANSYFGHYGNGLVLSGNYGNHALFKGKIIKIEKIIDAKTNMEDITYKKENKSNINDNIYYYASGY